MPFEKASKFILIDMLPVLGVWKKILGETLQWCHIGAFMLCILLKVISGQQLPKPPGSGAKGEVIDPFVTIDVHGIPSDNCSERTSAVKNNGMWAATGYF